jgi:hypothetical protein
MKLNSSLPLEGSLVGAGRVETETQSESEDPTRETMGWRWALIRLAPMLAVGLIPFVVLLFTGKNDLRHYVSPDLLAVLGVVGQYLQSGLRSAKEWMVC